MNTKFLSLFISLCMVFGCAASLQAGPFSGVKGKPQSPVSVSIEPVGSSGDNLDFVVTATSQINAPNFTIIVYPPKEMKLISGDLSWHGPVQSGETKRLRFTGSFAKATTRSAGQRVLVNAVIQSGTGPRFSARASYVFPSSRNNVKGLTASQATDRPHTNTRPRGKRRVIEYPVNR